MNKKLILLSPAYRDYLWGGEKLRSWGKDSPLSPLAESWEVSCRADGMTCDAETGMPLDAIWHENHSRDFPLLIKLIDAARDLSVQVHPDDAAAQKIGQPFGKSECWYVLEAEPGAKLALGLEQDSDRETLRRAAQDGTLASLLHWVEPKPGECYFIPAGMIHALGAGIMVAEVQQNSDTTYRLYDYGRLDASGNPRPLHLEQALAVADLCASKAQAAQTQDPFSLVCGCPYFHLYHGRCAVQLSCDFDFAILIALSPVTVTCGEEKAELQKGQTLFIQGGGDKLSVSPEGEFLFITEGALCAE